MGDDVQVPVPELLQGSGGGTQAAKKAKVTTQNQGDGGQKAVAKPAVQRKKKAPTGQSPKEALAHKLLKNVGTPVHRITMSRPPLTQKEEEDRGTVAN